MAKLFFVVVIICFYFAHCGGSTTDENENEVDTELTLSNCTTSVDDNVPDFFKTYFKCAAISFDDNVVIVESSGLPPHRSYYYGEGDPNFEEFDDSGGEEYSPNPNQIEEQDIHLEIPADPTAKGLTVTENIVDGIVGTSDEEYPMGVAGVALDSVPLFNPLAAPGHDIEEEQYTFDSYNAHPTDDGQYHYHTTSPGPLEVLEMLELPIEIYGIMCDGTVVLGCTELDGTSPNDADFDPQNGHTHDLRDANGDVLLANRYHTHLCPDLFPNHIYTPEIQFYDTCTVE